MSTLVRSVYQLNGRVESIARGSLARIQVGNLSRVGISLASSLLAAFTARHYYLS